MTVYGIDFSLFRNEMNKISSAINGLRSRVSEVPAFKVAEVVGYDAVNDLTVVQLPTVTPAGAQVLQQVSLEYIGTKPDIGDTVTYVDQGHGQLVVIGIKNDATAPLPLLTANEKTVRGYPTANRSTTSTAYVDWPVTDVLSTSFTKKLSGTNTIVCFGGSGFFGTAGGAITYAVRVSGTDYELGHYFFNTANDHRYFGGTVLIPALAPSTLTFTLRLKLNAAGFTMTVDPNDLNFLDIREVN